MKVAFATVDGERMNDDHFGQSPMFVVLKLDGSKVIEKEVRKNPYADSHVHARVDEILEVVGDCKVWVGKSMGKGSMKKLVELGYHPILTEAETLDEALNDILKRLSHDEKLDI